MAADKPEVDGFLAILDRKIAALKALADSYRAALSLGALGQPGDFDMSGLGNVTGRSEGPIDLPQGALLQKSLPAAVKLWLTAVRKKQTAREIAAALREGGVESTSPNFENVVTGALHRLKASGDVLRFKDGWGLTELYPASLRSSLGKDANDAKPAKAAKAARRTKKAAARKSAAKAAKAEPKATRPAPAEDSKTGLMLRVLASDSSEGKTIDDMIKAVRQAGMDCSRDYVRVVMKRLGKRGDVEARDGKFYMKSVARGAHQAA